MLSPLDFRRSHVAHSGRPIRIAQCALALSVLLLTATGSLWGQDYWTGDAGDNRWDNPDNWESGFVPEFGEIRINGPEADGTSGPIISDGIEAFGGVLIADAGDPVMKMTGGSLELSGWGTWWADAPGTTANFEMSGGEVNFIGNPGIMELGWQNAGDPIGSSTGIWTMTGGEVYALGVDMPGKGNGGVGIINLWGGILSVGVARGGLILYEGATVDITHGELLLEGDQTALLEDYVGDGWVTAFAGDGELVVNFDGTFTSVTAVSLSMPGDFNQDQVLDVMDIDLLTAETASGNNNAEFDLNDDMLVDQTDIQIWVVDLRNTWIGDADVNGEFNTTDLVSVLSKGKYEQDLDAVWSEGDWNGDGRTDSGDLVAGLAGGGYEAGPRAAVSAVPEPQGWIGLAMALATMASCRRFARRQTAPTFG